MKTLSRVTICLVLAVSMVRSQDGAPTTSAANVNAAREHSPEVRQRTFEKVWETVRDKFFDPQFNGVDWNKMRERYSPEVALAKTDAELYRTLTRMLGELRVSHMEIIPPDVIAQFSAPPVTTGLGLRSVEGQVVVLRVLPGSSAEHMGFRPGFVITSVAGENVKDLDDALARLGGTADSSVRVGFLDEHDQARELSLERSLLGSDAVERQKLGKLSIYALLEAKRLDDGIGYIRFTSFIETLEKKLSAAIDSMRDAPGLIIDLRGNGGGDDSVAIKLANHLFDRPTQLMITRTRKGESKYYRARPTEHPYLGPVAILIDEGSASASEQLTAGLQELGRAYVIGKKTKGEDMDAEAVKLPTGAYFVYAEGEPRTPKGVVIEGRGVIPDLEVSLTRAELLKGNDAQLSAAIQYIKEKEKRILGELDHPWTSRRE